MQADVVIGVPDSGLDAALGYAQQSGIPYGIGFIKNKYIGRTFIQPTQAQRESAVRIKLNAVALHGRGQARGAGGRLHRARHHHAARSSTCCARPGATEVHMRVSAPPFLHPCYFGTDIDSRDKLIACNHMRWRRSREMIGVDTLGYLSVEHLQQAGRQ